MAKHSRRYNEMVVGLDRKKRYSVTEAIETLLSVKPKPKFDESIDLVLRLGIDIKQADQMIRGSFQLPHGTGKAQRVIAFCEGTLVDEALAAGATEAGSDELIAKIKDGWLDFDVAVAHPSMMRNMAPIARTLGPKGKMPSPKNGTVSADVVKAVGEFQGGRVEYRADANGNVHIPVGRASWETAPLVENVTAFVDHIQGVRPPKVKGTYMISAALSATMGPSVKLAV